jgi:FlaA1/EpsC-like NDP-sugar epimerase
MVKNICIYRASNSSILKVIGAINREKEEWGIIGFIDDTPEKQGKEFYGHAVLGGKDILESLAANKDTAYFNNVFGSMPERRKVAQILEAHHCRLVPLITPGTDLAFVRVGLDVAIEANYP